MIARRADGRNDLGQRRLAVRRPDLRAEAPSLRGAQPRGAAAVAHAAGQHHRSAGETPRAGPTSYTVGTLGWVQRRSGPPDARRILWIGINPDRGIHVF